MKKSIIALAVAGAMTAPMIAQADATLYGTMRFDIQKTKGASAQSEVSRVRVGIKGSEQTNAGLTAGYHIRFNGANGTSNAGSTFTTDRANMYLAGDFGRVTVGLQANPSEYTEDRVEYSMHSGSTVVLDPAKYGAGLMYNTNNINGFQFFIATGNVDKDVNTATSNGFANSAAVTFDNDQFGAALSINKARDTSDVSQDTAWAISGSTKLAGATIGARYSKQGDLKGYGLGAKYGINDLTLAGNFETSKVNGADRKKNISVSASYALGGNASVALGYINYNEAAGNGDQVKARYTVSF